MMIPSRPAVCAYWRNVCFPKRYNRVQVGHADQGYVAVVSDILYQTEKMVDFEAIVRKARSSACWITGPSAMGSENGRPSSMMSAPASAMERTSSCVSAPSGSPQVKTG